MGKDKTPTSDELIGDEVFLDDNAFEAYRAPAPFNEVFSVPGMGGKVSIEGISTVKLNATVIARYQVLRKVIRGGRVVKVDDVAIDVSDDDILSSAYAEACVKTPVRNAVKWMRFASQNRDAFNSIVKRCWVCCRVTEDEAPGGAKDGLQAGKEANEEIPLDLAGEFEPDGSETSESGDSV